METDGFFVMMILFLARKLPVCITFCRRPTVSGLTFTTYIPALFTSPLSVPLIVLPSWPGTGGPKGRASPHESDERNVKRADDV